MSNKIRLNYNNILSFKWSKTSEFNQIIPIKNITVLKIDLKQSNKDISYIQLDSLIFAKLEKKMKVLESELFT